MSMLNFMPFTFFASDIVSSHYLSPFATSKDLKFNMLGLGLFHLYQKERKREMRQNLMQKMKTA